MTNLLDIKNPFSLRQAAMREAGVLPGNEIITTPGKFEREHYSILYYYEAMMEGDGTPMFDDLSEYIEDELSEDEINEQMVAGDYFEISPLERAAFEIEDKYKYAILWHSDAGFESIEYVKELPEGYVYG